MRFHNLQLLRVAAALGVVGFHLDIHGAGIFRPHPTPLRWLLTGWWVEFPVPLFFALSGFVLTHALQTAPRGRFLFARFLRLYPGYWLAMALGLVLVWYGTWPADQRAAARFSTTALTLTPGGKGYYVLGGVEWSLIYEVMLSVMLTTLSLFGVKRGLPLAVAAWLAVLAVKAAVWPGYATEPFPRWQTVLLSAYSVPFLLGVLAYYLRDTGRWWRWVVLAALVGFIAWVVPRAAGDRELHWCAWGVAGGVAVWVAVQLRQVAATNPLARLGDYTYGLYLVHVPIMLAVFYRAVLKGWDVTPTQLVLLAGAAAVVGGLLYGKLESALHARLRPLAKADAATLLRSVRSMFRGGPSGSAGRPGGATTKRLPNALPGQNAAR
jgi:peptidoglycan/LPS O-acetylase OafA/YrhL